MNPDTPLPAVPESSLSMLIAVARKHVKYAVESMVEPYGVNAYQCWMLLLLKERGPMSLGELAGLMWMDHPTASRLVHALEEQGVVQIQPDPHHGRKVLIALHPEKACMVDAIHEKVLAYRDRLEHGLSTEEKAVFRGALVQVIQNLTAILDQEAPEKVQRRSRQKAVPA